MNTGTSATEDSERDQSMTENNFAGYTFAKIENLSCVGDHVLQRMNALLALFISMNDPQTKAQAASYFT